MSRFSNRLLSGGSFGLLSLILGLCGVATNSHAQADGKDTMTVEEAQKRVTDGSKYFLENKGQWDSNARFLARSGGLNLWVTSKGLMFDYYRVDKGQEGKQVGHVVGMDLLASKQPAIVASDTTSLMIDFFNTPSGKPIRGARTYREVSLNGVYEGIDVKTYFDKSGPRYDFIVKPGADANQIKFKLKGSNKVSIGDKGELVLGTQLGLVKQTGLFAYQMAFGQRVPVKVAFKKLSSDIVAFDLGAYDKSKTLVIDPLVYGSYYGGDGGWDEVRAVVADATGGVYITGATQSPVFPNIFGPYGFNLKGGWDSYISKFQGDAYSHDYCAFVGGSLDETGDRIQLDPFGDVWIAGRTESSDYPGNTRPNVQYLRLITPFDPPDGGQFRLGYAGDFTNQMPYNASAALIQAELEGLPGIGPGNVTCTQGPLPFNQVRIELDNSRPLRIVVQDRKTGQNVNTGQETTEGIEPFYVIRPISVALGGDINPQILTRTGSTPSGGSFTLTFIDQAGVQATTAALPFNASAAQVAAALAALPNVGGAANVVASGGPMPDNPGPPITITFQGTLVGPQNRLRVTNSLTPQPDYDIFKYTDIFVQRFKRSDTVVLDPLPTRTFMIGASGDLESNYDEAPGGSLGPFGRFFTPLAGMVIVPKLNPAPTDPVEIIVASSTINDVPGIPGSVTAGSLDSFIYRVNFQADTFNTVAAASKYSGSVFDDEVTGLACDSEGSIYLSGTLYGQGVIDTSLDPSAFQTTPGVYANGRLMRGQDAYIRKYARDGTLVYSALLGGNGSDDGRGIAVDNSNNAYITGIARSFNFPRTRGVFGETFDANANVFVTKINVDASQMLFSTNLRTQGVVIPRGIGVDTRGQAFVAGMTFPQNVDFSDPTVPALVVSSTPSIVPLRDALQSAHTYPAPPQLPTWDGWLVVLNQTAQDIVYGSYIGGNLDEQVFAPHVDRVGDVWIVGTTDSFRTYTLTPPPYIATGSMPTAFISSQPSAFKSSPDASPSPTGISPVPYGSWEHPFVVPQTIGASYRRDGFLTKLRVGRATIATVTLNPPSIAGGLGASSAGTVTLSQAAPVGGLDVTLTLNNTAASFDPNTQVNQQILNFPAGSTVGTFTVYSNVVTAPTGVEVRATLEGNFKIAQLTVEPWLTQLTVTPTQIVGGNTVVGRITLFQAATQDMSVNISSDGSGLLTFPQTVLVPQGQTSVTFNIETEGVVNPVDVPITASFLGVGKTQVITLLPVNLLSVSFDPPRVTGGTSTTGKVRLDGEAGGTFTVLLQWEAGTPAGYTLSDGGAPSTTLVLTFNQGDREKTFTVNTIYEPINTQRRLFASRTMQPPWANQTISGTLFIDAANLLSFTVDMTTVDIGQDPTGTVTISAPANAGGAVVTLTTSNPSLMQVPDEDPVAPGNQVIVPAGATSRSFTLTTTDTALTTNQTVTITASRGPASFPINITIRATTVGLALAPSTVTGGGTSVGTVTIGHPAPAGGITFNLSSSNPAATVPPTVTITAGNTSANFLINTTNVATVTTADITATSGSLSATQTLTITPIGVASMTLNPAVVKGGNSSIGTVTLDAPAPAGGVTVALSANPSAYIAAMPSSVFIPAGQISGNFTIVTRRVSRTVSCVITGTYNSTSASATLTIRR